MRGTSYTEHVFYFPFSDNRHTHTSVPSAIKVIHCIKLTVNANFFYIIGLQLLFKRRRMTFIDDLFPLTLSFHLRPLPSQPIPLSFLIFSPQGVNFDLLQYHNGLRRHCPFSRTSYSNYGPQYAKIKAPNHVSNNPFLFHLLHYISHQPASSKCLTETDFTPKKEFRFLSLPVYTVWYETILLYHIISFSGNYQKWSAMLNINWTGGPTVLKSTKGECNMFTDEINLLADTSRSST